MNLKLKLRVETNFMDYDHKWWCYDGYPFFCGEQIENVFGIPAQRIGDMAILTVNDTPQTVKDKVVGIKNVSGEISLNWGNGWVSFLSGSLKDFLRMRLEPTTGDGILVCASLVRA